MTDTATEIAQARMTRELQAAALSAALQIYTSARGPNGIPILSLEQCMRLACTCVGYAYSDEAARRMEQAKTDPGTFWAEVAEVETQVGRRQRTSRLRDLEDEARLFEPWVADPPRATRPIA